MKYIILLLLITSCSSSKTTEIKREVKTEKERIHFKKPLLKYIHKKNVSKRTQIAYI
jgi:hypothetical protein